MQTKSKVAFGTILALAIGFTGSMESWRLKPYLDSIGKPTVCAGHTKTVNNKITYTNELCKELFEGDFKEAFTVVESLVTASMSDSQALAFSDLVFNIGAGNFKKSTLLREFNKGNTQKACDSILLWKYAGGKDCTIRKNNCYGIINRREQERQLCLSD